MDARWVITPGSMHTGVGQFYHTRKPEHMATARGVIYSAQNGLCAVITPGAVAISSGLFFVFTCILLPSSCSKDTVQSCPVYAPAAARNHIRGSHSPR